MQKNVSSTEEKLAWKQLAVRPSPAYPEVNWSPAVEVEVTHARFDAPSQHPYCPGLFVDRHVVENASLIQGPRFTRDTPGCDEIPHGAPGEHEIVLRGRGSEGAFVVLYPDLIEPAQAVASPGFGFDPEPDDFETDPVFESPHLAAQKEEKAG
jgi:hypothetical protein